MNEPSRALQGRRILVVEDERLVAVYLRTLLQGWGCEVEGPVDSVEAALRTLEAEMPDAALLDVDLHGETSEPIAEALRQAGRPFVLVTALAGNHLPDSMRGATVIQKPLSVAKLRLALAEALPAPGAAS